MKVTFKGGGLQRDWPSVRVASIRDQWKWPLVGWSSVRVAFRGSGHRREWSSEGVVFTSSSRE